MKKRPTVYIDMDDTAVMFSKQLNIYKKMYPEYQYPQSVVGFFSDMEPMPGFLQAWKDLSEYYDLAFCTRPSVFNLNSYTEKAVWVRNNIGFEALEVLNLVPQKERIGEEGDYLIDDWDIHGQREFRGEFIHFGKQEGCMNWEQVTEYLFTKAGL
jgi:5'-nucleotidase